jgi:hypothetical protein
MRSVALFRQHFQLLAVVHFRGAPDEGILKPLKFSIKILSPTHNGLNAWSYLIKQKAYVKTAPVWKLKYGTRLDHDDFKDLNSEDNVLLETIL